MKTIDPSETDFVSPLPREGRAWRSAATVRWPTLALVAVVWTSAAIFGLYIISFFGGAAADGALSVWNRALPHLYDAGMPVATIGIGLHFVTGAILLVLGPLQLFGAVRNTVPALHRWIGRIYAGAALIAGLGGVVFIALKGTIGGPIMSLGFGLYGILTVLAAAETVRHAMRRRFEAHRAWAIRLFALAIGSWLYRMDYGFWLLIMHGIGHTRSFDGPFDVAMAFLFYVPNLLVAEIFIRAKGRRTRPALQVMAALTLAASTAFLLLGTYYFTKLHWGPPIVARLFGRLAS